MDKLWAYQRSRDKRRVEFYSELRGGRQTFIIREAGGQSQDSVTTDRSALDAFRERLLQEGYSLTPW